MDSDFDQGEAWRTAYPRRTLGSGRTLRSHRPHTPGGSYRTGWACRTGNPLLTLFTSTPICAVAAV